MNEEELEQKQEEIKKKSKQGYFASLNKRQRRNFIIRMCIIAIALFVVIMGLFPRTFFGDEFGDLFLGEGVQNGFAALGSYLASIGIKIVISLLIIAFIFVFFSLFITLIRIITYKGKKAKTIGSLINSLLKYVAVILAVYIVLSLWGVDLSSIVASLGILTLIIGLGCQSLINDIVSGIFIVFDNYFDLGDMVIVDGFRGFVSDIGLRSIRLIDDLGIERSINNSEIVSAINMSRHPNLLLLFFNVSYHEDLDRVESVLADSLPPLHDKLPKIIEGPWYKGVNNLTERGVEICIMCTCRDVNRYQVSRDVKREVYRIFRDNNIDIGNIQIALTNQANNEIIKATEKDKKKAKELNEANRVLTEEKKEDFMSNMKKVITSDANINKR